MIVELEEKAHAALQALQAQAEARHMALGEYLQLLADEAQLITFATEPSPHEFERLLDQLSEGLPFLPALPEDFSRNDIYLGHD